MELERIAVHISGDFFKCMNLNSVLAYVSLKRGESKESSHKCQFYPLFYVAVLIFILLFPINNTQAL